MTQASAISLRFAMTMGLFMRHVIARIPDLRDMAAEKDRDRKAANSRHANSKKAVDTRKAKYGDSKMKRDTRDDRKKRGWNVRDKS